MKENSPNPHTGNNLLSEIRQLISGLMTCFEEVFYNDKIIYTACRQLTWAYIDAYPMNNDFNARILNRMIYGK